MALAAALACTAGVAHAVPTVFASQFYSVGGAGPFTVSDGTVADVLPFHNVGPDSIFGHTYALPYGYNGSRSSGTNNFNISGLSQYQDSFTNSGATSATFNFPFEITAGEVSVQMDSAAVGQLWATVGATINLTSSISGPSTALTYAASMHLDNTTPGSPVFGFSESGTYLSNPLSLGGGVPTGSGTSYSYTWAPYLNTLSLTLAPGETISLDYVLTSSATGNFSSLGACTGTGIGGPPGDEPQLTLTSQNISSAPSNCYNAAIGRIGDPFNPEIVPQSVPEPSTLALLGLGFMGALRLRRRR